MIVAGASACSSNKDSHFDQRGIAPEGKHEVYQGPLYQAYRSVQESKDREKCDQQNREMQSILITALDLKSGEILKNSLVQKNHPEEYVPFNKSYLVNTPKKPATKGWKDESYSWNLVYDYYVKNVDKANPQFWTTIDTYVRSLITDDRKRVVYGYNLTLNYNQVSQIPALKETLEACNTDTRCTQPRWSEEQRTLIKSIPAYSFYQSALESSRSFKDQRYQIGKLFERIQNDFILHREDYNSMISHTKIEGKNTFSLSLDSGIFSETDQTLIEKSITSVWKNDLNSIVINWKKATPSMDLFHILFTLEPNNRSFVNFNLKEINLFPFTAVRTVAHEYGHVLGFDDHYYTVWNSEKCEYHAQYNEEDIMSDSETGDVTNLEWQTLLDKYGNR